MDEHEKKWRAYAGKHLVGRKIVGVGYMAPEDAKEAGWHERPLCLELSDGTTLYLQSDDEGNGPGALAGETKAGEGLLFPVLGVD